MNPLFCLVIDINGCNPPLWLVFDIRCETNTCNSQNLQVGTAINFNNHVNTSYNLWPGVLVFCSFSELIFCIFFQLSYIKMF